MNKKEIIKKIENTIIKLSNNPKEKDTILALKKQILYLMDCKHGTYTNELFNTHGCKTCGSPKLVICNNNKVIGKRRNEKSCNINNCKYFEPAE